jgi:hypothetical protein
MFAASHPACLVACCVPQQQPTYAGCMLAASSNPHPDQTHKCLGTLSLPQCMHTPTGAQLVSAALLRNNINCPLALLRHCVAISQCKPNAKTVSNVNTPRHHTHLQCCCASRCVMVTQHRQGCHAVSHVGRLTEPAAAAAARHSQQAGYQDVQASNIHSLLSGSGCEQLATLSSGPCTLPSAQCAAQPELQPPPPPSPPRPRHADTAFLLPPPKMVALKPPLPHQTRSRSYPPSHPPSPHTNTNKQNK